VAHPRRADVAAHIEQERVPNPAESRPHGLL